jgi:uncharacterized protein YcfJ
LLSLLEILMNLSVTYSKWMTLLALGGCLSGGAAAQTSWSTSPQSSASEPPAQGVYSTQVRPECPDCGRVTSVSVAEKPGDSNAAGVIAGGVIGGVLGHQIGKGRGKDLATIAGAIGGAYAGKKIQESANAGQVWTVGVKYPDGHSTNFDFDHDPGFVVGDSVRNSGQTVVRD